MVGDASTTENKPDPKKEVSSNKFEIEIPNWLLDWGNPVCSWMAMILATIGGSNLPKETLTLADLWHKTSARYLLLAAVVMAIGLFLNTVKEKRLKKHEDYQKTIADQEAKIASLQDELAKKDVDYYHLAEIWLKAIVIGLKRTGHETRGTIYKFEQNAFFRLGRWSDNPEYCNPGRDSYLASKGLIAQAWKNGESFASGLPDGQKAIKSYRDEQVKLGLDDEHATNLRMKSRSYACFAIRDKAEVKMAVLVLESVLPEPFSAEEIEQIKTEELPRLTDQMCGTKSMEPQPYLATGAGL